MSNASKPNYPRGFALVMTLLLIAIAGAALGIVARHSLGQAARAESTQTQLQHEWGTRSIQRTMAPRILDTLQLAESTSERPLIHYHTEIDLNGLTFHMVLGDEQAKTNLNTLLQNRSELEFEQALQEIVNDRRADLALRLDPISVKHESANATRAFPLRDPGRKTDPPNESLPDERPFPRIGCYEQVWPSLHPTDLINLKNIDQSWTANLTLWGSGRVLFKRANSPSIHHATRERLNRTDVEYMISLRDTTPALGIERALNDLDPEMDPRIYRAAQQGLTDSSHCQSLWVVVDTGRRWRYHLAIVERQSVDNAKHNTNTLLFEW